MSRCMTGTAVDTLAKSTGNVCVVVRVVMLHLELFVPAQVMSCKTISCCVQPLTVLPCASWCSASEEHSDLHLFNTPLGHAQWQLGCCADVGSSEVALLVPLRTMR